MLKLFTAIIALVVVGLAFALGTLPAAAMRFQMLETGTGQRIVVATGEIRDGDARMLGWTLDQATRDRNGMKELTLDSPGGLVREAFSMAGLMDKVGVTTIVPAQAVCASACASVLFVSGKYRSIEKGGVLAIHSCYDDRSGQKMDDCNALISIHAQYEGSSGLAMMALQEVAGTRTAIGFDAKGAACFGLTKQPGASTRTPPCIAALNKAVQRRR